MSIQDRHETIGRLVAAVPTRARVFERHGIDYCCGGHRPLDEVARERGLDLEELVRDVEAADADAPEGTAWLAASDQALITHILDVHHRYLRQELPALRALVHKVERVHGERHPELAEVRKIYDALAEELTAHMLKEEQVLFPMMQRLCAGEIHAGAHCGGIANPLRVMRREHEDAGLGLARLRSLTRHYATPEGACNSYRAMLARLEHLERDTHEHVHEEENVLFPRFARENPRSRC